MVVPRGYPQIVIQNDADLPQGGRGSSARTDTNFLRIRVENGRNQKANARIKEDIARVVRSL